MTRSRTLAIAGLTAGLLAGGGVGLSLGLPSVAGAQTSATTTTPVDVTAPTDHTTRLRTALQPLVDQGTLTAAQVDAVVAALEAARPDMSDGPGRQGGGHQGKGVALDIVATLLNSTRDEVATALRDGTSIADQAEAAGVPLQSVVDALVADLGAKLEAAVEEGRLTQQEADEKLAAAPERLTTMLVRSGPLGRSHHGGRLEGRGMGGGMGERATPRS